MLRAGLVAAVVAWVAPSDAHAWRRTTADDNPNLALWWSMLDRDVDIHGAWHTSRDLPPESVRAAVLGSFGVWEQAGGGCTDIQFHEQGPPSDLDTNLSVRADGGPTRGDGENRIVWREDLWPDEGMSIHGRANQTLALTTVLWNTRTGQITDADIDVNGVYFDWTVTDDPEAAASDVGNVITHELGHLLGFAHSEIREATMFSYAAQGELDKRDLSEDDILAVCTTYPTGEVTPEYNVNDGGPMTSGLCAAMPGARPGQVSALAVLAPVGGALAWRRRPRRGGVAPRARG